MSRNLDRRRPAPSNDVFEAHDSHDHTKTYYFHAFRDEEDTGVYLNFVEDDRGKDGMATIRDMMWISADQCEEFASALFKAARVIRRTANT